MEIILLGFLIRFSLAIIDIHFFPLPGGEFDAFSFNRVATEFSDHLESGKSFGDFDYKHGWIYSIFVGYVYYFFGASNLLGSFLSCLAWFFSALILRNIMIKLNYQKNVIYIALLIYTFLFPTSIIFTSLMLREAYLLLFSNLLFLLIVNFYNSNKTYQKMFNLIFFIITSIMLALFHKAGVLFIGSFFLFLTLFLLIKSEKIKIDKLIIFIIFLFSIFIFEYVGVFEKIFMAIKHYQSGHFEEFENTRALYYSKYDVLLREYNLLNLFSVIIQNIFNYFFQPTIFKVSDFKDLPAVFENNLRILIIILLIYKICFKFENKSLFIVLFVMYLLSEFVYAQATVNWGTASRHHLPALGYLVLLLFFPKVKKSSIKENLRK